MTNKKMNCINAGQIIAFLFCIFFCGKNETCWTDYGYRFAVLALFLMIAFFPRTDVLAQDIGKTVRVGWYESPFNVRDELGRRSGYAYEYQQKIAAYTGWTYEYVTGSWPELFEMLCDGRIDLLSDVSYTEERSKLMLFSNIAMGEEEFFLFTAPENKEIVATDYSTFNGKKVGVNKGSVQAGYFRDWTKLNGVQAELVEMTETVAESLAMLRRGEIDMYIALDAYLDLEEAIPICETGASEYYFAVSRSRPELVPELNSAMTRILEEDPYYNQKLNSKYIKTSGVNLYLSSEELEKTLDALLSENSLNRSDLKLEVTESACTENPYQVIDVIERLRKKGFEIEMDDFGSGYSSLNMLSSMPIDVLKMDRAFVGNIEHNAKDIQLVELIIGIARNLKIPVIAEGVETEAQLRILKDMGCALVQGFVFSRPLPPGEFEASVISKAVSDCQR